MKDLSVCQRDYGHLGGDISRHDPILVAVVEKHWYGQYLVKVWKVEGPMYSFIPWRFSILGPDNNEWQYVGIPNYCKSRASALKRAWYRVKWMQEGTIGEHYK